MNLVKGGSLNNMADHKIKQETVFSNPNKHRMIKHVKNLENIRTIKSKDRFN